MMAHRKLKAELPGAIDVQGKDGAALDTRETAMYVADVALGLRSLANRAQLPFLAYLLEMVVIEGLDKGEAR
jgi:hypothetical protein